MLYSPQDLQDVQRQLLRRIGVMALLAIIPNIAAGVLMYTVRIQWLSIALGCLGGALALGCWGLFCYPVYAYRRFLKEILQGRSHDFTGVLTQIAQDSVREGVPCKTLYFCDDAGDSERLCYFDLQKYPKDGFAEGARFSVTVHGQSILSMKAE